jgi:hypothetical protein
VLAPEDRRMVRPMRLDRSHLDLQTGALLRWSMAYLRRDKAGGFLE